MYMTHATLGPGRRSNRPARPTRGLRIPTQSGRDGVFEAKCRAVLTLIDEVAARRDEAALRTLEEVDRILDAHRSQAAMRTIEQAHRVLDDHERGHQ